MHQKLFFLYFAFTLSNFSFSQTIDKLNTDEEVLNFVRKLNPEFANLFINAPKPVGFYGNYKAIIKKFEGKSFAKADFDSNGRTDLLFNGFIDDYQSNSTCRFSSFAVMSFGNDSFSIQEINLHSGNNMFSSKIYLNNKSTGLVVLNIHEKWEKKKVVYVTERDTLIYKFNSFIERTFRPDKKDINKITAFYMGGLGVFPSIKLTFYKDSVYLDKASSMQPYETDLDSGGIFVSAITHQTIQKIQDVINFINFSKLKKSYQVPWTDDINGNITIFYDDRSKKTVSDYGLIGTYGLSILHKLFFEIKDTQKWTIIAKQSTLL